MTPDERAMPDRIGGYRVLRDIARGGTAEVFEVQDVQTGQHLALKLLVVLDGTVARFNREYEAMSRLNHPNIVRVFHYGEHEGLPWMTMELLEGTPIASYAKDRGRPGSPQRTQELLRVVHDLSRALDHVHRRGLIHRDLKSANVLVLPDGRAKLLDFGSARVLDGEPITTDGEFIGTFSYASPEQIMGSDLDYRTDIYSLGILVYRLLTGKMPFTGDPHQVATAQVKVMPTAPRRLVPDLAQPVEDLIMHMLAKSPEERPESGEAIADRIEELIGGPATLPGTVDVAPGSKALVGREDQVESIRDFLDAGRPASMLIISGPRGSGRRALADIADADARARGWPVYRCALKVSEGLGPMVHLLRKMARSCEDATLIGEAEATLERTDAAEFGTRRRRSLHAAGRAVLDEVASRSYVPVLLLFRSAHHATLPSMDLVVTLQEAAAKTKGRVVFVLEGEDTADPMFRLRFPNALRVGVPPLSPRQVSTLVGAMLHRRPPPAAVALRIHEMSGGQPAYVEEIVRGLVSRGLLKVRGAGGDRLEWAQEDIDVPVPHSAAAAWRALLYGLPWDQVRLLETLALLEGEGDDEVMASALDRTAEDMRPALLNLERIGIIELAERNGGMRVTWRHRLAQEVVLETLHVCRSDLLKRRLLGIIENSPPFAAQIRLLVDAGRVAEAVRRAISWGQYYLVRHQPMTALQVLDGMVEVAQEATTVLRDDLARLFLLHAACLLMVQPTDVRTGRSLARAKALGGSGTFGAELALVRARAQRAIGHYPRFRKYLLRAWDRVDPDTHRALGGTIAAQLGDAHRWAGQVTDAVSWYDRSRKLAKADKSVLRMAEAEVGLASLHLGRGRVSEAERIFVRAVDVYQRAKDERGMSLALPGLAHALRVQGRYSEALGRLGVLALRLRQGQAPSFYVRVVLATGWCELDLCRFGRVQECVDELAAVLRRGEHLHLRLEADLLRARAMLESDSPHEARVVGASVLQRASAGGLAVLAGRAQAVIARLMWDLGDYEGSMKAFDEAQGALLAVGDRMALAEAVVLRARAMSLSFDPAPFFERLLPMLKRQSVLPLDLERQVAGARFAEVSGGDPVPFLQQGRLVLQRLRSQLDESDRAALRVHPWSRAAFEEQTEPRVLP